MAIFLHVFNKGKGRG